MISKAIMLAICVVISIVIENLLAPILGIKTVSLTPLVYLFIIAGLLFPETKLVAPAFFSGMLYDLFTGGPLGLNAVALVLMVIFIKTMSQFFSQRNILFCGSLFFLVSFAINYRRLYFFLFLSHIWLKSTPCYNLLKARSLNRFGYF